MKHVGLVSKPDMRRIGAAVRAHERKPFSNVGPPLPVLPHTPRIIVNVKITGNRTGGGKYAGLIVNEPGAALSYSGNLSAAEIGNETGAAACTAINPHEEGESSHLLTETPVTCHFFAAVITHRKDENNLPVVRIIGGIDLEDC